MLLHNYSITETPQPSPHCPRKHGYFAHEEKNICDKFYYCVDGKSNMITCPDGLVYNEKTGICTWPDEAKKKGCSSEGIIFTAPPSRLSQLTYFFLTLCRSLPIPVPQSQRNGSGNSSKVSRFRRMPIFLCLH